MKSTGLHRWAGKAGFRPTVTVLFKVAYCWGLRRNEVRHLQTVDFARNPHAREFGKYGVLQVRYGKAMRGSPPKHRSVLTVFDWAGEVVADWLERGHRPMTDGLDLFPSERGTLGSETALNRRFNRYCEDLGLSPGLDIHSLRRSYITHLTCGNVTIGHRQAKFVPVLTQDQRLAMLKACLTDDVDTLTYRVACCSTPSPS